MEAADQYRFSDGDLLDTLDNWDSLMNFRVRLIACGGTALTLLKIKSSTKDIDFIVPAEKQYYKLIKFLRDLVYEQKGGGLAHEDDPDFIYQFWCGNRVFTTELLYSPLDHEKHIAVRKWRHIYLGALNIIGLITTKMFRGTDTDVEDCIAAFEAGQVDAESLLREYLDHAQYDLNPEKVRQNFVYFIERLAERRLVNDDYVRKARSSV